MRKLLFLLLLVSGSIIQTSCSKDDSPAEEIVKSGSMVVTINGAQKTFSNVVVNENVEYAGTPDEYTMLTVTGTIGTSTNELIIFKLDKGDLGANAIYYFEYKLGSIVYYNNGTFSTNVTTNNTSKKLVGNFSGNLDGYDGNNNVTATFTDCSFSIQY